jgi:hypothetical protein
MIKIPPDYQRGVTVPIMERIWERTEPIPECGCYIWMGALGSSGYGQISVEGKRLQVHNVTYEQLVGPIPDGMQLDHLCRVRSCWRPDHLELVTPRENTLRGIGPSAVNARRTHCINGHAFTEDNTYYYRGRRQHDRRFCRQCNAARRNKREQREAEIEAVGGPVRG